MSGTKIQDFSGEYEFLSNFYERPFFWYGRTYPSLEHAYQAAKATNAKDWDSVFYTGTPGESKKAGRKIKCRSDWEHVKYNIMEDLLMHKFRSREMAELLVATGDAHLLEGNVWHDNIWGNCWCPKCKDKPGTNWLGIALMTTRARVAPLV